MYQQSLQQAQQSFLQYHVTDAEVSIETIKRQPKLKCTLTHLFEACTLTSPSKAQDNDKARLSGIIVRQSHVELLAAD